MTLSRGDTVPEICQPSGLVGHLIAQPLTKTGDTLDTDATKKGKLMRRSGDVSPISDFKICDGTDVADPYHTPFSPLEPNRIIRAYVARVESTCPSAVTFLPVLGLEGDGYFDPNPHVIDIVTFGPKTYGFFSATDVWTLPQYAGEHWRITVQDYPYTTVGSVWMEGVINGSGFPVGLNLNVLAPNVYLLEFVGVGIVSNIVNPDFPDGGPEGPQNTQFRYKLFYSCQGEWLHVEGITPW